MEAKGKRLFSGITLGALLIMAFVLVQPTLNQVYAVGAEGLPEYDDCDDLLQRQDPISMNTVRSGSIVKTIHAEKAFFECSLDQGRLRVIVDLTTYIEIYENIDDREVIETNAVATICLKDDLTATVIDCQSYDIPSTPVFVGSGCFEEVFNFTHPQEMNTVNKGRIAKTIEAQKEFFSCFSEAANMNKRVDIILFTEIYEDLSTQETIDVQFLSVRCVTLQADSGGDLQDVFVESCIFTPIQN